MTRAVRQVRNAMTRRVRFTSFLSTHQTQRLLKTAHEVHKGPWHAARTVREMAFKIDIRLLSRFTRAQSHGILIVDLPYGQLRLGPYAHHWEFICESGGPADLFIKKNHRVKGWVTDYPKVLINMPQYFTLYEYMRFHHRLRRREGSLRGIDMPVRMKTRDLPLLQAGLSPFTFKPFRPGQQIWVRVVPATHEAKPITRCKRWGSPNMMRHSLLRPCDRLLLPPESTGAFNWPRKFLEVHRWNFEAATTRLDHAFVPGDSWMDTLRKTLAENSKPAQDTK